MDLKHTTRTLAIVILTVGVMPADEAPPALSLSAAAKLAEEALATASERFPADCILRSIILIQKPSLPAYYQIEYKSRAIARAAPAANAMNYIYVAMDGKISFEHKTLKYQRATYGEPGVGRMQINVRAQVNASMGCRHPGIYWLPSGTSLSALVEQAVLTEWSSQQHGKIMRLIRKRTNESFEFSAAELTTKTGNDFKLEDGDVFTSLAIEF